MVDTVFINRSYKIFHGVGQFLKKISRKYRKCREMIISQKIKQLEQLKYNLHNKCGLCGTVFEKNARVISMWNGDMVSLRPWTPWTIGTAGTNGTKCVNFFQE